MYVARIAPLDKRSIDLFDALNANNCTKLKFQELASNVQICSVEGHEIAVEAEGDATEDGVDEGNVLLMADTSELFCFNTKPKEHFFVPVIRALEPHILELRSGSDLFVGRRDWNVRLIDIIENPIVPPVERDVGTI